MHFYFLVHDLTATAQTSIGNGSAGYYDMNHGILLLWTDKNNLRNTFVIKNYLAKHLFTALMAFIMLTLLIIAAVLIYPKDATTSFA